MSEPNQNAESGGISEALNKKWGPFPAWLYLVAVGLAIFLFIYLRRQNSSSSNSADNTQTVAQSTRPPFINQVYTNTTPPESSNPADNDKDGKKTRLVELKKGETLQAIAKQFKVTKDQLIRLNPDLANKYENTGKRVPKGTKVRLPLQEGGGGKLS